MLVDIMYDQIIDNINFETSEATLARLAIEVYLKKIHNCKQTLAKENAKIKSNKTLAVKIIDKLRKMEYTDESILKILRDEFEKIPPVKVDNADREAVFKYIKNTPSNIRNIKKAFPKIRSLDIAKIINSYLEEGRLIKTGKTRNVIYTVKQ